MSIWANVQGEQNIGLVCGTLMRLVESQQHIATLSYVDTLEEQALLEQLLEDAKPPYQEDVDDFHYLLKTPFRYPPLQWGSRFGQVFEPSLFYAGLTLNTVLAESAYYRLVFWHSMTALPSESFIRTEHTLFSVPYRSARGIQLHQPPFSTYESRLTSKQDYLATQELGSDMRRCGVEAFEYISARDPQKGQCIGLFSPAAFKQRQPSETSQWLCELSNQSVVFKQVGSSAISQFSVDTFLVDGNLPFPA